MEEMIRIPAVIYRGGTSKAVFLKENDLPADLEQRNRYICAIFGSRRQRMRTSIIRLVRSISCRPTCYMGASAGISRPLLDLTPLTKVSCEHRNP
jgi:hypothetical protein